MLVSYNWLQTYFKDPLPPAREIADKLLIHSFEIEGVQDIEEDVVIDVDILPNRAHDCLSHRGIAREVSILFGIPLMEPEYIHKSINAGDEVVSIDVANQDICKRYVTRKISNVVVGESPEWLKKRLLALGQKPINNIVDATNYIMFDIGQPMHAFDAQKVSNEKIIVRNAKEGESVVTLSDESVELDSSQLVIADDEKILAIAGVKGGKDAQVTKETTDIILESAVFEASSVRQSSRISKIQTDSSKRFENPFTPDFVREAMDRICSLIQEINTSDNLVFGEIVDIYNQEENSFKITVSQEEINQYLGISLTPDQIDNILKQLRFSYTQERGSFTVTPPKERIDLRLSVDIIEEIARIYGYSNIPKNIPEKIEEKAWNTRFYWETKIRQKLISFGFSEIRTYSFAESGDIEIANPASKEKSFLRTNLHISAKESVDLNEKNKDFLGLDVVKIFEIGSIFSKESEELSLVCAVGGKEKQWRKILEDLKSELQKVLGLDELPIIFEGEGCLELSFSKIIEAIGDAKSGDLEIATTPKKKYEIFSTMPIITRDVAVWVSGKEDKNTLEKILSESSGAQLIKKPRLIDEFAKDGKISYAYRLVFQAPDRTLKDEEVNEYMGLVYKAIKDNGWEVR